MTRNPTRNAWNSRPIVLADGQQFDSMRQFAHYVGRCNSTVSHHIRRGLTPDDIVEMYQSKPRGAFKATSLAHWGYL